MSLEDARASALSQLNNTPNEKSVLGDNSGISGVQQGTLGYGAVQNDVPQNVSQGIRRVYSHHSLADYCKEPSCIKHLIKGYIQEHSLGMLFGESGSGKSFIAVDMCGAIACETISDWHGKTLKHGPVVYLAGEGAEGLKKRFNGWAVKRGVSLEDTKIEIIDEVFTLDSKNPDYYIDNTIANIKAIYEHPALVVVDTVNRYMEGDENKAVDTAYFIGACEKIIRELGCSVLLIHHTGVAQEAKNRVRGSSAFRGAMDIEIKVEKNNNLITLKQTKNKEAKAQEPLIFNFEEMNIPGWFDEDGLPVTTCTIELNSYSTNEAKKSIHEVKLSKGEIHARDTFKDTVKRAGIRFKDEEAQKEFAAVFIDDWRKLFYEQSSADNDNARKQQFQRARKTLLEDKKLLIKKIIDGKEYYCLELGGEEENVLKLQVIMALRAREKQAEKCEKIDDTTADTE